MGARVRLLARLGLANLRHDRWRWLLTTVGIAVGVASFTGILAISSSIIHAFELSVVRTAGRAQIQVSNGSAGVGADLIDAIQAVPGVEVASGTVQYEVTVPALGRRLTVFGILFGADHRYREAQFGKGALRLPDAATFVVQIDSVALSDTLLRENGWKLGSRIEVVGPKGPRTLVVRGTLDASGALSVFGGDVAVMDSDAAQHAFGQLDRFHWIDVVAEPDADLVAVRAAVERAVGGRGVVETPVGRGRRMEAMLGTLRWMLTACGTIAMLVGVFLIQHTVATDVRRRRAELVTLRAIGATRWVVTGAVLAEALLLGAIGSAAGIAAGIGFAKLAVGMLGDAVGAMYAALPPPPVTVSPAEFVACAAIGEGAVLVAASIPCFELLRMRPGLARPSIAATVRPAPALPLAIAGTIAIVTGLVVARTCGSFGFAAGIAVLASFVACEFLGMTLLVPGMLASFSPLAVGALARSLGPRGTWTWKQMRRHAYHTATTMGALAAAVAFTIGLTTLLGSYRSAIAPWLEQTIAADVFVTGGSRFSLLSGPVIDRDLIGELGRLDGVARVMPWRFVRTQFRDKPVIVQAAPPALIDRWHEGISRPDDPHAVIISETLAERFGLDVGDRFVIPAPTSPLELTVAAVTPDYLLDLGSVTVPWNVFERHFGQSGANILFVDESPGVSSVDLKRRIDEFTRGYDVTVLTGAELAAMADKLIDQSFALTTALQLLAVLVTVLAMINATSATILDRRSDLAIWRAVGLERVRLVRLLAVEAGLTGLLASVLGACVGMVVGRTLVQVVAPAVAGFRLPLAWPLAWIPSVIVATTIVAAVTAWLVARTQMPRAIVLRDTRV